MSFFCPSIPLSTSRQPHVFYIYPGGSCGGSDNRFYLYKSYVYELQTNWDRCLAVACFIQQMPNEYSWHTNTWGPLPGCYKCNPNWGLNDQACLVLHTVSHIGGIHNFSKLMLSHRTHLTFLYRSYILDKCSLVKRNKKNVLRCSYSNKELIIKYPRPYYSSLVIVHA